MFYLAHAVLLFRNVRNTLMTAAAVQCLSRQLARLGYHLIYFSIWKYLGYGHSHCSLTIIINMTSSTHTGLNWFVQ